MWKKATYEKESGEVVDLREWQEKKNQSLMDTFSDNVKKNIGEGVMFCTPGNRFGCGGHLHPSRGVREGELGVDDFGQTRAGCPVHAQAKREWEAANPPESKEGDSGLEGSGEGVEAEDVVPNNVLPFRRGSSVDSSADPTIQSRNGQLMEDISKKRVMSNEFNERTSSESIGLWSDEDDFEKEAGLGTWLADNIPGAGLIPGVETTAEKEEAAKEETSKATTQQPAKPTESPSIGKYVNNYDAILNEVAPGLTYQGSVKEDDAFNSMDDGVQAMLGPRPRQVEMDEDWNPHSTDHIVVLHPTEDATETGGRWHSVCNTCEGVVLGTHLPYDEANFRAQDHIRDARRKLPVYKGSVREATLAEDLAERMKQINDVNSNQGLDSITPTAPGSATEAPISTEPARDIGDKFEAAYYRIKDTQAAGAPKLQGLTDLEIGDIAQDRTNARAKANHPAGLSNAIEDTGSKINTHQSSILGSWKFREDIRCPRCNGPSESSTGPGGAAQIRCADSKCENKKESSVLPEWIQEAVRLGRYDNPAEEDEDMRLEDAREHGLPFDSSSLLEQPCSDCDGTGIDQRPEHDGEKCQVCDGKGIENN